MKQKNFTVIGVFIVCLILLGITSFAVWAYNNNTQYDELQYQLEELEDGIYGYYSVTVSSIPANNYQIITVYYCGSIRTLKGHVQICYTNNEPKIFIKDYNIVNSDVITIYVPKGSIVNTGVVSISSRG